MCCPVRLTRHGARGLAGRHAGAQAGVLVGGQAGAPPVPMRSFTCIRPQEVLR